MEEKKVKVCGGVLGKAGVEEEEEVEEKESMQMYYRENRVSYMKTLKTAGEKNCPTSVNTTFFPGAPHVPPGLCFLPPSPKLSLAP